MNYLYMVILITLRTRLSVKAFLLWHLHCLHYPLAINHLLLQHREIQLDSNIAGNWNISALSSWIRNLIDLKNLFLIIRWIKIFSICVSFYFSLPYGSKPDYDGYQMKSHHRESAGNSRWMGNSSQKNRYTKKMDHNAIFRGKQGKFLFLYELFRKGNHYFLQLIVNSVFSQFLV